MRHPCFFVLGLLLYACETAVEVDVPRYPAQLTVNSLFNPDSVWQVELTQNRYILDNEPFASVPDAEVRITQQGRLVASLQYQGDAPYTGNSVYRAEDSRPQAGEVYTLEVKHPTLGNLTATSQVPVPPTAIISAVLDTLDVREGAGLDNENIAYAVTIRLDDPPEENFYSVTAQVNYLGFTGPTATNFTFYVRSSVQSMISDDPIVDNPFDRYRDELLFNDVSFNGKPYELKVYVPFGERRLTSLIFYKFTVLEGDTIRGPEGLLQPGDMVGNSLSVTLRTTTEEYYNYNYTRDLQALVENNPFAQPVQVFDNIEGGLGVFAGYIQVEKEVTF